MIRILDFLAAFFSTLADICGWAAYVYATSQSPVRTASEAAYREAGGAGAAASSAHGAAIETSETLRGGA